MTCEEHDEAKTKRTEAMTKRERVLAAIRREPTDRTPYAFWRHFPTTDRSPAALSHAWSCRS